MRITETPLFKHVVVIGVFLGRDPVTLFGTPADFVQADQRIVWDAAVNEFLHRLLTPLQSGRVNLIDRNVFIAFVKQSRLRSAELVQISIDATPLDDIPKVEIRLSMTYEVNFFTDQFLHYFVAVGRRNRRPARVQWQSPACRQRRAKIAKLLIDESLPFI